MTNKKAQEKRHKLKKKKFIGTYAYVTSKFFKVNLNHCTQRGSSR